jgi:hypothetical protein
MSLAVQQYEREDTEFNAYSSKYDAFLRGTATLSDQELRGLALYNSPTKGNCAGCHPSSRPADGSPPLFTDFTYDNLGLPRNPELERNADPTYFDLGLCQRADLAGRTDLCGAFKVPSLRNVALTAPYFHNGGQLTLRQVVDFYNRQGDFANPQQSAVLGNLGLTETQKNDLVAFLQSLTDPRVASASAPFDHPQLFVPSGVQTANGKVRRDLAGQPLDCFLQVPATGAAGGASLPQFPSFTGPCVTPPALRSGAGAPGSDAPPVPPSPAAPPTAPTAAAAPSPAARTQVKPAKARRVTRCVVPRLTGHSLAGAKRMLKRAHCALGHVTRAASHGRRLVVRAQAPKARSRHKAGARVRLTLRPVRATG